MAKKSETNESKNKQHH